jgi:hypothetical protein
VLGSTGSGKTKLIEHLIQQDILAGKGLAIIDPHGDLVGRLVEFLAARFESTKMEELADRLILIEPFNPGRVIGFNPLEAQDQPFAVAVELAGIFRRFWADSSWGPRMDELLRNTLVTLAQNGLTLLEARPLLTEASFRDRLLERVWVSEVRDYWCYRYSPLSDKMQGMYREPVLNKVTAFISDPAIARILGQRTSTVDFRQAMDRGKWVFLNLSKGHLRDNLHLLGTLFLAKMTRAALSRIDTPEEDRRAFLVYLDEFQNFIGEDIETVLSEARKFRLGLVLAHQTLEQLPTQLRSAILGNVGTAVIFRLSHRDAAVVSSELDPGEKPVIEKRLIDLPVARAYLKIKGGPPRLFKTIHVPPTSITFH